MPTLIVTSNFRRETSEDYAVVSAKLSGESKFARFPGLSDAHSEFTVRLTAVEAFQPTDTKTTVE